MSTSRISIFYTGATGYIGGSVLQRILAHPKVSAFDITVLVRSTRKAEILESKFRLKTVVGSLQDLEQLTENAEGAGIVIHTADADDEPAMKAILTGMKQRHERTGVLPILIHTSGAALLADDARGAFSSETITSDLDVAALDAIPVTAIHRTNNLLVESADSDGYARTYIVLPSGVYGIASGPLFEAEISKKHSLQIPWLSEAFIRRGRAGIVGTGASISANVHIEDMADLYYRLFDAALSKPDSLGHGRTGYFFVENGEHPMHVLCSAIGDALVALGVATTAQPTELTPEDRTKYFGGDMMAFIHFCNMRCRADRGRKELGWTPQHTTDDMIRSVRAEVEAALQRSRAVNNADQRVSDALANALIGKST